MRNLRWALGWVMIGFVAMFMTASPIASAANQEHSSDELMSSTLGGGSGTLRVLSAQRAYGGEMGFLFGFHAEYFNLDDFFAAGDNTSRMLGQFSATFVPCSFTEIYASWMALSSTDNTSADLIQQFGNFNLGAKVGMDLGSKFSLSAAFQAEHMVKAADLNLDEKAWNYWPQLLASMDFTRGDGGIPLKLHLNGGYRMDSSIDLAEGTTLTPEQRYYLNIRPNNQVTMGFGVEVPAEFVNFTIDYTTEQDFETDGASWTDNPQRLTLGAKLFPTRRQDVSIDAGADIGLGNDSPSNMTYAQPDYNIIFGVSYASLPSTSPRASNGNGSIAGIVLEDGSLKPLGNAHITFPEIVLTRLQSHPDNGTFGFGGIAPGTFTAHCELDGYEPADLQITVTANSTATPEFRLKKKMVTRKGTLTIRLTNADKKLLDGKLQFLDHPTMEALPIAAKGLLAKLPAETFRIQVSADGYQSEEHTVTIEPDGKLVVEYILREDNTRVQLVQNKIVIEDRIHFQSGKSTIKPDSFGILNRVADLITDTPTIAKLRVEGHTDNVGNANFNLRLSQKRAEAVMQYLVTRGIAASRLEAAGYGMTRPIQPNDTPEGRGLNRRVEFTVVGGDAASERTMPLPSSLSAPDPMSNSAPRLKQVPASTKPSKPTKLVPSEASPAPEATTPPAEAAPMPPGTSPVP